MVEAVIPALVPHHVRMGLFGTQPERLADRSPSPGIGRVRPEDTREIGPLDAGGLEREVAQRRERLSEGEVGGAVGGGDAGCAEKVEDEGGVSRFEGHGLSTDQRIHR